MMKEELEDIFGFLDLEHNVDIYVDDYVRPGNSYLFKIQIIAWEQNVDIDKLYDSVMECIERSKSIDGITTKEKEIAWSYRSQTYPECYHLRSKKDIERTRKVVQNLYNYYNKKAKFFGFIVYLNYLNAKITEIKKWNEF